MQENPGSTSISELPGNFTSNHNDNSIQNNNSTNNIIFEKNPTISESTSQMPNPVINQMNSVENNNQTNYNELISQLQKANMSGVTSLPSRDIPTDTIKINNDVEIKPNYIPDTEKTNYVENYETTQDLISQNNIKQNNLDNIDKFYNEFQLPLLVSVLYFLFQLPIFKKNIKKLFPLLFNPDANPNFYGHLFNSSLFAIVFYILVKIINNISIKI
tara:strand:- start:17 stop:664 length:648 start_codon:yes stop_codon:yes gene_type:complete